MENKFEFAEAEIHVPKAVCTLSWEGENEHQNIAFVLYRDFNWFQRLMIRFCFGLKYNKA